MLILSDLHLGLKRKVGATLASNAAYTEFQFSTIKRVLSETTEDTLLVLGDLFAEAEISNSVFWRIYEMLSDWEGSIHLCVGNHDQPKDHNRLSSIALLSRLLPNTTLIDKPTDFATYRIIPHLANQDQFDAALENTRKRVILLHCNYDNPFAAERDHSLNLTPEQAARFDLVISGHEHERRNIGNVYMLGSAYPCSVAECSDKFVHTWDGVNPPKPQLVWEHKNYIELDWRELRPTDHQVVRVTGEADASEAAYVIQEVATLRANSQAFMITNSVKVGSLALGDLDDASEDLAAFDPVAALKSVLSEKHRDRLEEVLR